EKRDECTFSRSYDLGVYKFPERLGQIFFSPSIAGDDMYSPLGIFPEDGQFHHVAATYDGATDKIFLDGIVVASTAHSRPIPTTSSTYIIGTDRCGHPSFADMYCFKLFDRALSDQEVMNDAGDFGILSDGVSALLSGNNTFSGNQTINGTVMATSFSGDGSAL